MAVYTIQIHENMLNMCTPVKNINLEIGYTSNDEGADIFVGGARIHGELFRHLFHLAGAGSRHVIHNLQVSCDPYDLRIISNSSLPNHLVIRMYCWSMDSQLVGVLSEHQMVKLAD